MRAFFQWHFASQAKWEGPRTDDNVFKFLRKCEYGLPELFAAIEVFARKVGADTDYSFYIAQLPRFFRAEAMKNLEEHGVPIQISERFFRPGDTVSLLARRLRQAALGNDKNLTAFQRKWILDALPR